MKATRIFIHCSATPNGKKYLSIIDTFWKWHVTERNWRKIGYHYVIDVNGQVWHYGNDQRLRGLNDPGAGVRGHNHDSIHICMVGTDQFSKAQFTRLEERVRMLRVNDIGLDRIYGHYEFNGKKTCPGMRITPLVLFLATGEYHYVKQYIIKRR